MNNINLHDNIIDLQHYFDKDPKIGFLNDKDCSFVLKVDKNASFKKWFDDLVKYECKFSYSDQKFYLSFSRLNEKKKFEIVERLIKSFYSSELIGYEHEEWVPPHEEMDFNQVELEYGRIYELSEFENQPYDHESVQDFKTNLILKYEPIIQDYIYKICDEYIEELLLNNVIETETCRETGFCEIVGFNWN